MHTLRSLVVLSLFAATAAATTPPPTLASRATDKEVIAAARSAGAVGKLTAHEVAATGSMQPVLFGGDLVVTAPADSYAPGDIVVARINADKVIVHRVAKVRDDGRLMLRGDNVTMNYDIVAPSAVVGRVYAIRHGANRTPARGGLFH